MDAELTRLLAFLDQEGVTELVLGTNQPVTVRRGGTYIPVTADALSRSVLARMLLGSPFDHLMPQDEGIGDMVEVEAFGRRVRAQIARRGDDLLVRIEPTRRPRSPTNRPKPAVEERRSKRASGPHAITEVVRTKTRDSRADDAPALPKTASPPPLKPQPQPAPPVQQQPPPPPPQKFDAPSVLELSPPPPPRTMTPQAPPAAAKTMTKHMPAPVRPPAAINEPLAAFDTLPDLEDPNPYAKLKDKPKDKPPETKRAEASPPHGTPAVKQGPPGISISMDDLEDLPVQTGPAQRPTPQPPPRAATQPPVRPTDDGAKIGPPPKPPDDRLGPPEITPPPVLKPPRVELPPVSFDDLTPPPPPGSEPPPRPAPVTAAPIVVTTIPPPMGEPKPTIVDERSNVDKLVPIVRAARQRNAADLHLSANRPVLARVASELVQLDPTILTPQMAEALLLPLLGPARRVQLAQRGYVDLALEVPGAGRLRGNVSRQQGGLKGSFRLAYPRPPTLDELGLPATVAKVVNHHQGLVVITGPSGHGKTTTLAAFVDLINASRPHHILTVEDPVEIEHPRKRAVVSQREVGRHTVSFAAALKASLREDPDVIVIGELRDRESVEIALTASETGHLVLATMSTPSAAKTIDRLIDMFPPDDQQQVRASLAGALRAILSQRLLPRADGSGVVAAVELLTGVLPLAALIRDNKLFQLPNLMQRGKSFGMIRLDDSLTELTRSGAISQDVALRNADNKRDFVANLAPPAAPPPRRR